MLKECSSGSIGINILLILSYEKAEYLMRLSRGYLQQMETSLIKKKKKRQGSDRYLILDPSRKRNSFELRLGGFPMSQTKGRGKVLNTIGYFLVSLDEHSP